MQAHTHTGAKQLRSGLTNQGAAGASSQVRVQHEAAEDAVCLGATVNQVALCWDGVHRHPVARSQAQHAAARVHLQDVAAVVVAEADHALRVLGDAQAQVSVGDHLVGEVVNPGDAAGELPGLGAVGVLLVGDDVVEHHCGAAGRWRHPRGREGRMLLLLEAAGIPLGPFEPRLPWLSWRTRWTVVALVPWDARRPRFAFVSFGSSDARPRC